MLLRPLACVVAILAVLRLGLAWHDGRQARTAATTLVDAPLIASATLAHAHRIVVREKPQSKLLGADEDGFQVRLIVEPDAPHRETMLERRDGDRWVVASCFNLEADPAWLGQTMRDLTQGRLVRPVTSDPALMTELELGLGYIRIEDARGAVLRTLDFGRKDGGEQYAFVRVDGGSAFVAKHTAELVGDPLAWIFARVLRFDPAAVRSVEVVLAGREAAPFRDERSAPGEAFASPGTKRILDRLAAETVLLALDPASPHAIVARERISARVTVRLWNGTEYRVSYGVVPRDAAAASAALFDGYPNEDLSLAFFDCSDADDLAARYGAQAVFVYYRATTLDVMAAVARGETVAVSER